MSLARRLLAEALGTGLLIVAVVGSGIMATNLTDDVAIRLLANSGATVGALIALILMFGRVSGANFNPIVTLTSIVLRQRPWSDLVPYAIAQTVGGCLGAVVANAMFDIELLGPGTTVRSGGPIWLGEVVATFGLLLVIFLIDVDRPTAVPFAVGVWIGGAYWFTSSTSLANPAVTIARSLSDSFAGVAPESILGLIVAQCVGMVVAVPALLVLRRT